jgi:hypothetical protein
MGRGDQKPGDTRAGVMGRLCRSALADQRLPARFE